MASRVRASKQSLYKKRAELKEVIRKAGIRTLQQVLNTTIISDDAKIKHIRHNFTCYDKYLPTFYRNEEGVALRKELNTFLLGLVRGQYSVQDLRCFNEKMKNRLEIANDNYVQQQKDRLIDSTELSKPKENSIICNKEPVYVEYVPAPNIPDLTDKEKEYVKEFPVNTFTSRMTEEYKIKLVRRLLEYRKNAWKITYKSQTNSLKKYLVELYLLKRSPDFYPTDFSDLDYMYWRDVVKLAEEWIKNMFGDDEKSYRHFLSIQLPAWVENNKYTHKDEILEKLQI